MPQTARNIAIIALVALGITVLPGGGTAADTALSALQMAFLAAIAFSVYRTYNSQQLTIASLSDAQRATIFGAGAGMVLLVAGYEKFESWGGGGVLLWIALMAGAVAAIFVTWRRATSFY